MKHTTSRGQGSHCMPGFENNQINDKEHLMTALTSKNLLIEHGIVLDFAPPAGGNYVPVNVRGNIAYVAIQFSIVEGGYLYTGRLGEDLNSRDGYNAARLAAMNVLSQIHKFLGLDRIEGLNHVDLCYKATETWDDAPGVANGASDLFVNVLGPKGKHSRSLFGVHALPKNFSVGVTASFLLNQH